MSKSLKVYFCPDCGALTHKNSRCRRCVNYRSYVRQKMARYVATGTFANVYQGEDWFAATMERQGGRCAICSHPLRGTEKIDGDESKRGTKTANIDHDHETQRARGLLCTNCNTGLGMFQDSPSFLTAAALYLEEARKSGAA